MLLSTIVSTNFKYVLNENEKNRLFSYYKERARAENSNITGYFYHLTRASPKGQVVSSKRKETCGRTSQHLHLKAKILVRFAADKGHCDLPAQFWSLR